MKQHRLAWLQKTCIILFAILFLASFATAATRVQWFGQAAIKLTSPRGKVIVIDPFITKNPVTPAALKDLKKIGPVDLILLTHGHGDHVGDTVKLAQMTGARVGLNADMGRVFAELGWLDMKQLVRFNKGGPITPLGPGVTITMVHADHSSAVVYPDPTTGKKNLMPGGDPCGYIITMEDGFTIYHAGDTGVFGDMAFISDFYKPHLALLPIGGHFTMDPAHAAYAVKKYLPVKTVIPIHYGTFPPLKGTPDQFIQALGKEKTKTVVMRPGEERMF